jgi:serine/threonine protein kinase
VLLASKKTENDEMLVAIKRISKRTVDMNESEGMLQQLENEVASLKKCSKKSSFVMKYQDSFKDAKYYYIVSEYMPYGSLESLRVSKAKKKGFEESQIEFIAAQLVVIIKHVHDAEIIHR